MSLLLESHASQDLYPRLSSLDPGTPTIRLIDILPGDFAAPIHCQLVEHKLRQTLSYKALSYSWKTDEGLPDVIIFCNAKPIYISANLHAALQRLRSPHDQVTLWVDAICINQQDDDERAYQVGMMRDIYKNSSEVLIWLGGGGAYDDTGGCVSIGGEGRGSGVAVLQNNTHDEANIVQWFGDERDIPKLKAYFSPSSEEARRSSYSEKTRDIFGAFCVLHLLASGVPVDKIWHLRHVHYSMGIVNGLNEILDKPWETVVAKRQTIYYANMCAPWRMFALAAVEYDTSRVRDNLDGIFSLLKSGQSLMQFARVIMEIEATRRSWEKLEPMVPLTLLRKFRSRLATDPRDKVFAILGLIRSWGTEKSGAAMTGITPDYTVRAYELFWRTTELLIRNRRSLAVLAGTLQGSTSHPLLPSWVTDWNCPPSVNEHLRLANTQLYNAAEYVSGNVALHGRSILETQGCLVDEIDYVGPLLENEQGRSRARLTVLEWQNALSMISEAVEEEYVGGGTLQEAFWRTLCADVEFVQYAETTAYVREFRRLPEKRTRNEAYERWLHVDEQPHRRTSIIYGLWVEPTNSELETESRNAFQYLLECASSGRRFFRTRKGYIGTGPADTKVGDSVAVLGGSRVPFVLREDNSHPARRCAGQDIRVLFSDRSSYQAGKGAKVQKDTTIRCYDSHQRCHRVVGDAYVHGIMTGEAKRTFQWFAEPIYLV